MRTAVIYTILSLVNLIGVVIGVSLLPAEVPIHFDASLTADTVGSPWVYLAFPAVAALLSAGIWAALAQKRNRTVTLLILSAAGIVLSTVGWTLFGLAASGAKFGEKADFPFALIICFPLSLFMAWLGGLPYLVPDRFEGARNSAPQSGQIRKDVCRLGGRLFFLSGVVSAVFALLFGLLPAWRKIWYVAFAVWAAAGLISAGVCALYVFFCRKRERQTQQQS